MNIFLPYCDDLKLSVKTLDDKRLNKQILETYQILQVSCGKSTGYSNHPVVKHYAKYPKFLIYYGWLCCNEYEYRFGRKHKIQFDFEPDHIIAWQPFYCEGNIKSPSAIREYDFAKISQLFRDKLALKWNKDIQNGRLPKWTNRDTPLIFKEARKHILEKAIEKARDDIYNKVKEESMGSNYENCK